MLTNYILTLLEIAPAFATNVLFVDATEKLKNLGCPVFLISAIEHTSIVVCFMFIPQIYHTMLHLTFMWFGVIALLVNSAVSSIYIFKHRNIVTQRHVEIISAKPFNKEIASIRGIAYFLTCLTIFAVDLPDFNSNSRKSSYFGFSLMDTGVGFFVIFMGFVSRGEKWYTSNSDKKKFLLGQLKTFAILMILGFIRLFIMKIFNLTYPYLEYGIHLNVFFILAFVKIIGSLIDVVTVNFIRPVIIGGILLVIHEILLNSYFYSMAYIDGKSNRISMGFLMKNIESIVSLNGHVALFLISKDMANFIYSKKEIENHIKAIWAIVISISLTAVTQLSLYFALLPESSRRMANLNYVCCMISLTLFFIGFIKIFYMYYEMKYPDFEHYLVKLDKIGLVYFIVGNLLVGLYRLRSELECSSGAYVPIYLYIYATLNIIIARYCHYYINKFCKI